jgi:hypothetical protein
MLSRQAHQRTQNIGLRLNVTNCTFAQNKADYAPAIFKG